MNNAYLMGHAYHYIGLIHHGQLLFELAIENYLNALQIFEKEHVITQIPYLLLSLGRALMETRNFDEALGYFQEALPYYLELKDRWGLVEIYQYLGSTFFEMRSLDSARVYFDKSLNVSKEINNKRGECIASNKLGEVYIYLHQYDKSLEYLRRALELNSEIENDYILVNILYNTGICHVYSGKISLGLDILHEGLVLADSKNFRYERMILNKEISNAYAELQNYRNAYEHYQLYAELHDSVYQEQAQRNMVEMEQKFQAEKKNIEIGQLKLDNAEQELNIRKQKSFRNLFVACFLFAFVTGLLLFRGYRRKKRADSEKEALLKEIHHRVKNNLQIISSLLNIQTEYVTDLKVMGAVQESQSRVKAMALIHQLLYQEKNLTSIDFGEYMKQLSSTLSAIYQKPDSEIELDIHVSNVYFDIETSIPLGLIITELVSNAYKHAFERAAGGRIEIELKPVAGNKHLLVVADNGVGLPPGADIHDLNTLGLKLVNILTGQLDGRFSYEYQNGARFMIEFAERV
jgi:two-component sensor histidine kinase